MASSIIYVGVKAHLVAVDKATGSTLWQTKLKSGITSGDRFVSLLVQDGRVYAHTYGELFCLNQQTGAILWKNGLAGMGFDIATLASEGASNAPASISAAIKRKQAADSSAGMTATGGAE